MEPSEPPLDPLLPRYSHMQAQHIPLHVFEHHHWDRPEVALKET